MTGDRTLARQGVPTLTEVLALPEPGRAAPPGREPSAPREPTPEREPMPAPEPSLPDDRPPLPAGEPPPPPMQAATDVRQARTGAVEPPPGIEALTERVLADLQAQIEGSLEYRLREVLTPILARAADALVRDARQELSKSLRDVVARSVAQEMQRQRSR